MLFKKIIVSSFIILGFTTYAVYHKLFPANLPNPINYKKNITNTNQPVERYKDGEYLGSLEDAYYGNVRVKVLIEDKRIADVNVPIFPNERPTSREINSLAVPTLATETIMAQKPDVDIVTGATQTSRAFIKSLESALNKALTNEKNI